MSMQGAGLMGGGTNGGGANGGGTNGGGTPDHRIVNALGDSYASPIFCSSLTSVREACTNPGDTTTWSLPLPVQENDQRRIGRWDPWVRSYLCAQTLISDITIQSDTLPAGAFRTPTLRPHVGTFRKGPLQSTLFASLNFGRTPKSPDWRKVAIATLVRPSQAVFQAQLTQVIAWADLRQERISEILTQIENTYAFWGAQIPIQSDRLRNTRELLDAVVQFAMFVEMRMKNDLAVWRPTDYSPEVQPMITTPGHGSMPCGHCTEGYAIKEVLQSLLGMNPAAPRHDGLRTQFSRIVARMSMNRVIAGVHFPVDNIAGRLLGKAVGRYFAYRCRPTPKTRASQADQPYQAPVMHGIFRGDRCTGDEVFAPDSQEIFPRTGTAATRPPFYEVRAIPDFDQECSSGADAILEAMWNRARDEIKLLQLEFA